MSDKVIEKWAAGVVRYVNDHSAQITFGILFGIFIGVFVEIVINMFS